MSSHVPVVRPLVVRVTLIGGSAFVPSSALHASCCAGRYLTQFQEKLEL